MHFESVGCLQWRRWVRDGGSSSVTCAEHIASGRAARNDSGFMGVINADRLSRNLWNRQRREKRWRESGGCRFRFRFVAEIGCRCPVVAAEKWSKWNYSEQVRARWLLQSSGPIQKRRFQVQCELVFCNGAILVTWGQKNKLRQKYPSGRLVLFIICLTLRDRAMSGDMYYTVAITCYWLKDGIIKMVDSWTWLRTLDTQNCL